MNKRIMTLFLAVGIMSAVLSGCGDSSNQALTPEERAAANVINVGIAQDLDESLDPHKVVAAGTKEVMFNVFEGLVKPTPDGELIPAVAEDWTISDDRLTYTFTLREGVKFHNGDTVSAEDVVYSIDRATASDDPGVIPVPAFESITSVEAVDEGTVAITIDEPSNEFLSYLTVAVVPADYTEQDTAPVGTGPFKYVSRVAQDNVVLERFDDYWGTPASLDRVTYKIIENGDSLLMSLQSGAIDLCSHLTSTQVAQLPDTFYTEVGTMNLVQALYLNNAAEPLDDVRVRQALSMALDRQQIFDLAFDGYGHPIGSNVYPAFGKYFDESLVDYYDHDVEGAKALLAEAGFPDGFDLTITVPSNYKPHMDTAEVLVNQLAEIGVRAVIQPIEWKSWLEEVYAGRNFQATVVGLDASNMTARALLERYVSTFGKNFINYSNAEYDRLFEDAQACYNDEEQTAIYKEMERNLTENAANVYIQDLADLVAVRSGLEGVEFYPIYVLDLSTVHYAK